MPTEDPNNVDISKQQPAPTGKVEAPELSEDELEQVSGGGSWSRDNGSVGTLPT